MKQLKPLKYRIREHHMNRAYEATTLERYRYHMLLAASINLTPASYASCFQGDWRDARVRWCARMRAAEFARRAGKVLGTFQ